VDAFTLRGFLTIAALAGVPVGAVALVGFLLAGADPPFSAAGGVVATVGPGATVAGGVHLAQLMHEMRNLTLAAEDLLAGEEVMLESEGSMVHYRRGRQGGIFDSVGGRLVLTNRRLVFLAHRGQPYHYRLSLPLGEIAHLEVWPDAGIRQGELLVEMKDGQRQLFTFGFVRAVEPEIWAGSIADYREQAYLSQDGPANQGE
jgi:hypothetical protein